MVIVFGSIEFLFKNHKSNGFYLESTQMRNIHAFASIFTLANVAILWITIISIDYSKRGSRVSKYFKITYSKRVTAGCSKNRNANYERYYSIFNTRITLV